MLPWQVELSEVNKQIQSCSRPNTLLLKTNWELRVSWVTQKKADFHAIRQYMYMYHM